MASPNKRYFQGSARLAWFGALAAIVISCGENGYDVSVGGDATGGKSGHAGNGSLAGASTSASAGRAGSNTTVTAGRSAGGSGGIAGAMASSAGRGGDYGGSPSVGGDSGTGGAGVGGDDTAGGVGSTVGGTAASDGGSSAVGGANTSGGITGANGGAGSPTGGTVSTGGRPSAGTAGVAGSTTAAGSGPCGLVPNPTGDRTKRQMLLRDEGVGKLAFVDIGNPTNGWVTPLPREQVSTQIPTPVQGRDLQLVGGCRVMVGTDIGYEEYDIRTGQRVSEVTTFPNTISAQRLRNGNNMLVGVGMTTTPYQGSVGLVLVEVNAAASVVNKYVYPGGYTRLVRQTPTGTFLVTNNTRVIEGYTTKSTPTDTMNQSATVTFDLNKVTNCTSANPHVWQALRIPTVVSGVTEIVATTGFCASLAFFRQDGTFRARITGGTASIAGGATAVNAYFFAGFQLLSNGNYLVTNWAGHGAGNFTKGIPVLEYTPSGALAWYWGDPAYKDSLSGIQAVILLDGLDPTKLHLADTNGQLVPVN